MFDYQPVKHATYSFGESFTISVEASDDDGTIEALVFIYMLSLPFTPS